MRIKTILPTAAFIVAFVFSAAFANLFVDKSVSTDALLVSNDNLRKQQQILNFLEQDRQYGRELSRDLRSLTNEDENIGEETATLKLVRKMRRLDDSAMPLDFRTAWENHVRAWEDYADSLHRSSHNSEHEIFGEESSEGVGQTSEINRTYRVLVRVARQHGVDFPY